MFAAARSSKGQVKRQASRGKLLSLDLAPPASGQDYGCGHREHHAGKEVSTRRGPERNRDRGGEQWETVSSDGEIGEVIGIIDRSVDRCRDSRGRSREEKGLESVGGQEQGRDSEAGIVIANELKSALDGEHHKGGGAHKQDKKEHRVESVVVGRVSVKRIGGCGIARDGGGWEQEWDFLASNSFSSLAIRPCTFPAD